MTDPLHSFDWSSLYNRYDTKCRGFNPSAPELGIFSPRPSSDRELYYLLASSVHPKPNRLTVSLEIYKAMVYWKLYSQPRNLQVVRNGLDKQGSGSAENELRVLYDELPNDIDRDVDKIMHLHLVKWINKLFGIKTKTALPVRTTFLHFLFPNVISIFDQMVLRAVGICDKDANKKSLVLRSYLPFVWTLADRYAPHVMAYREAPIRVIDMALWVLRADNCV